LISKQQLQQLLPKASQTVLPDADGADDAMHSLVSSAHNSTFNRLDPTLYSDFNALNLELSDETRIHQYPLYRKQHWKSTMDLSACHYYQQELQRRLLEIPDQFDLFKLPTRSVLVLKLLMKEWLHAQHSCRYFFDIRLHTLHILRTVFEFPFPASSASADASTRMHASLSEQTSHRIRSGHDIRNVPIISRFASLPTLRPPAPFSSRHTFSRLAKDRETHILSSKPAALNTPQVFAIALKELVSRDGGNHALPVLSAPAVRMPMLGLNELLQYAVHARQVAEGIFGLRAEWKTVHYYFKRLPDANAIPSSQLLRPLDIEMGKNTQFQTVMRNLRTEHAVGFFGQFSSNKEWRQMRGDYLSPKTPYCHIIVPECLIFIDPVVGIDAVHSYKKCCIEHERLMNVWIYTNQAIEDNKLPYYYKPGNIIGAFRHGTIVPWDSDADLVLFDSKSTETLMHHLNKRMQHFLQYKMMVQTQRWSSGLIAMQGFHMTRDRIQPIDHIMFRVYYNDKEDIYGYNSHIELWMPTRTIESKFFGQSILCSHYGISFSGCMRNYFEYTDSEDIKGWQTSYGFEHSHDRVPADVTK
jgi:hypothetical protein